MKKIIVALSILILSLFMFGCGINTFNLSKDIKSIRTSREVAEEMNDSMSDVSIISPTDTISDVIEVDPTEQKIIVTVENFYKALTEGKFKETQQYLDEGYSYTHKNPFEINETSLLKKYFSLFSITCKEVSIEGEIAIVELSIEHPYFSDLYDLLEESNGDNDMEIIENWLMDDNIATDSDTAYVALQKKDNDWKIISQLNEFDNLIHEGDTTILYIEDVETELQAIEESRTYIQKYLDIKNYKISEDNIGEGAKPYIYHIDIKNSGNRFIQKAFLNIDFLTKDGKILQSREVCVLDYADNPIKPNGTFPNDRLDYIELDNLDDGVNLDRANVTISRVELLDEENLSYEESYILNNLKITDFDINKENNYTNETVTSLSNLKIQNSGDRNITDVYITVYYIDPKGRIVHDMSSLVFDTGNNAVYFPVNSDKYALPYDYYYILDELGENENYRYKIRITDITFE